MKPTLPTLCLLILSTLTFAQKPDPLLIRVSYTLIKNKDLLPTGKPKTENMLLFVGRNASLYTSYDKLRHEIAEDQKFRMAVASGKVNKVTITDSKPTEDMSKVDYFYFLKENKLITKETLALQPYLVIEQAPTIDWKTTKDTLSFSGIKCFKATAEIDGNKWIAWYAPSYPFRAGPWKLYGLPGLIVEAYDENKSTALQFAGIESAKKGDFERTHDVTKRADARPGDFNPVDQMIGRDVAAAFYENTIKLPVNGARTTRKEFDKLKAAYQNDPKGFVRAQSKY